MHPILWIIKNESIHIKIILDLKFYGMPLLYICFKFNANIQNNFTCIVVLTSSKSQCYLSWSCLKSKRINKPRAFSFSHSELLMSVKNEMTNQKLKSSLFFSCFKRKMARGLGIYRKLKFVIENKKCICGFKKEILTCHLKIMASTVCCTVKQESVLHRGCVTL